MWNIKLHYQQLHLTYLCNLARYWLRATWGWGSSVETCRSSVIICETIVHLLVRVQKNQNKLYSLFVKRRPVPNKHFFYAFLRLPVDGCIRQPKRVVAPCDVCIIFIVLCYSYPINDIDWLNTTRWWYLNCSPLSEASPRAALSDKR
jgi:hypothetical protein